MLYDDNLENVILFTFKLQKGQIIGKVWEGIKVILVGMITHTQIKQQSLMMCSANALDSNR
jgi:hypothetical protein